MDHERFVKVSDVRFTTAINAMAAAREKNGIDINGKKYSMVKDRVLMLREQFGMEVGIDTHVWHEDNTYYAWAKVMHTATGNTLGSGHAMAVFGTDEINTVSIVEAVETAAIGRALASFGLHGGEYASEKEMEKATQGSAKMSAKEREFRQDVERTFPKVDQYEHHYVPPNNAPEELDKAFTQIDNIDSKEELVAYYHTLEKYLFPLLKDDMKSEFIQSFKYRKSQLRG